MIMAHSPNCNVNGSDPHDCFTSIRDVPSNGSNAQTATIR
jgi:hypothetical protein